jgi:hypothetical protein
MICTVGGGGGRIDYHGVLFRLPCCELLAIPAAAAGVILLNVHKTTTAPQRRHGPALYDISTMDCNCRVTWSTSCMSLIQYVSEKKESGHLG